MQIYYLKPVTVITRPHKNNKKLSNKIFFHNGTQKRCSKQKQTMRTFSFYYQQGILCLGYTYVIILSLDGIFIYPPIIQILITQKQESRTLIFPAICYKHIKSDLKCFVASLTSKKLLNCLPWSFNAKCLAGKNTLHCSKAQCRSNKS